jgi:hypothetical protein
MARFGRLMAGELGCLLRPWQNTDERSANSMYARPRRTNKEGAPPTGAALAAEGAGEADEEKLE